MYLKARKLSRVALLAFVAFGLAACDIAVNGEGGLHFDVAAGKAQDEWTRSFKVAPGGRFELINVNGKITAEASNGPTLEIRAERTAKGATDDGAREVLSQLEMREEVGETRVRIEVRPPRLRGPSGHEIKWTIKVPKGLAVDLRTINGGVKMVGLQGEIRARATNGGVTGTALLSSAVDAAVTNGGVEIELATAPTTGTFALESVNGGVSLSLPGDSKAHVTARCVNGGISVRGLEIEISGEQSKRRLEGRLNGGGATVSLETVNGGVTISRSNATT